MKILLLILLMSCKQFSTTKHQLTHRPTLFDRLIAEAPSGKVPYPFTELISYLSRYGKPLAVLVPLGRSLQRKAGYPDPFRDPRRLVTFIAGNRESLSEFDIQSRLYLGYVEGEKQIEVISLLPSSTDFDFQLVENYGNETKIVTPKRSLCNTCHRSAGPIFTPFPWAESNFNIFNAQLIADYYPNGKIDGIDIMQENSEFFLFDQTVRNANKLTTDNRIWQNCATTSTPVRCRKNLLQNTLASVQGFANEAEVSIAVDDANIFLKDRNLSLSDDSPLHGYQLTVEQRQLAELIIGKEGNISANAPQLRDDDRWKIIIQYATVLIVRNKSALDMSLEQRMMVKRFTDKQQTILNEFNDNQRAILKKAMRQAMQYIHSKDLHLLKDSTLDPARKYYQREPQIQTRFKHKIRRVLLNNELVNSALQQQVKLTGNKLKTAIVGVNLLITDKGIARGVIVGGSSSGLPIDIENTSGGCRNKFHCQLKDVPFFEGIPPATIIWQGDQSSSVSKLTVDAGDGHHRLDFKCWSFLAHHYSCSIFDREKVAQALNKIDDQFFASSTFDEVSIIKQLLAKLDYQLATTAWEIPLTDNFIDIDHDHFFDDQDSLQFSPASQIMFKYCGTCHSNEATPAPFLSSSNVKDFCDDFNYYRQLIHTKVEDDSMPPLNSPQRQSFTDGDKKKLLTATKEGLKICN